MKLHFNHKFKLRNKVKIIEAHHCPSHYLNKVGEIDFLIPSEDKDLNPAYSVKFKTNVSFFQEENHLQIVIKNYDKEYL